MRRILVTGMSGTGKSTMFAELARRGFEAVDTDEPGWTRWSDEDDGYLWRSLHDAFVSGTVSNQGRFYWDFDAVVLLSAPAALLLRREPDDEPLRQERVRAGADPPTPGPGRAAPPRHLHTRARCDTTGAGDRRRARRYRRALGVPWPTKG